MYAYSTYFSYFIWINTLETANTQHVLGIGTMWGLAGVVSQSVSCTGRGRFQRCTSTYTYNGNNAIDVWKNDWQCSTPAPPVESDGGGGTAGGHWVGFRDVSYL